MRQVLLIFLLFLIGCSIKDTKEQSSQLFRNDLLNNLFYNGEKLVEEKKAEMALKNFRTVFDYCYEDERVLIYRIISEIYYAMGDYDSLLVYSDKMHAFNKTEVTVYYNKVKAYLKTSKVDSALVNVEKFLNMYPQKDKNYLDGIKLRGLLYLLTSNKTKAIKDLKEASLFETEVKKNSNNVFDRYIFYYYHLLNKADSAKKYYYRLSTENDTGFTAFGIQRNLKFDSTYMKRIIEKYEK